MRDVLDQIFERELTRLSEASTRGTLEMEDIKKLEILTRALKQYQAPEKKQDNPFESLSTEDLLKLIRGETHDGDPAEPQPEVKRPRGRSKAKGV